MNKLDWPAVASILLVSLLHVNCSQAEPILGTSLSAFPSTFSSRCIGIEAHGLAPGGILVGPVWKSGRAAHAASGFGVASGPAMASGARLSAWGQAGVYGLEFLGACIGSVPAEFLAVKAGGLYSDDDVLGMCALIAYPLGHAFGTSTGAWLAGRALGERKHWWHAVAGSAVGTLVALPSVYLLSCGRQTFWKWYGARCIQYLIPPAAAVIGLNVR